MKDVYTENQTTLKWLILSIIMIFTIPLRAQEIAGVEDKQLNERIGDCLLRRIKSEHDGKQGRKTYEIDIASDGLYYLGTIMSPPLEGGKLKTISLFVDDKLADKMDLFTSQTGFQNVQLHSKINQLPAVIPLTKGTHWLTFVTVGNVIPLIDAIRLARNPIEAVLEDVNLKYINNLKQTKLAVDYIQQKKKANSGRQMANPQGNYFHDAELQLEYTYSTLNYFDAGTNVTFETRNSNSDPVLFLFQKGVAEPISNSWSNDDSNGLESSITCTIPSSGNYELLVRVYANKYNATAPGVSDIYLNGALYASQVPVAGKLFVYDSKNALTNTFTANTVQVPSVASDTKLYIASGTIPSVPVRYFNDDYFKNGGGDFDWFRDSRIKQNFGSTQVNVFVSAYSITTAGRYDFYGNCEFSNASSYFPNLKSDDAIQSAPSTSNYNCGSWAGGITSSWWFPNQMSDWTVSGNYLQSFDNFYGNTPKARYAGAYTYTRSGADESNASLALWYNNLTGYTHVSVRKPGNDHPHGYDWESKPGNLTRTMHPRDGLRGTSQDDYGYISNYYKYTGANARVTSSNKPITLEESIRTGLSKLDVENFDALEEQLLIKLKDKLSVSEREQFVEYFDGWQQTWTNPNIQKASNPKAYSYSKEYAKLLIFCKKLNTALLPMFVERFEKNDMPMCQLIIDALLPNNESLLALVKEENAKKLVDDDGIYIVRSNTVNCIKFLKKLLAKQFKEANIDAVLVEQNFPNTFVNTTTFRFYLPRKSSVTIEIYAGQGGQSVVRIADEVIYEPGWQTFNWDSKSTALQSGAYIYRVIVNGKVADTKRLMVK